MSFPIRTLPALAGLLLACAANAEPPTPDFTGMAKKPNAGTTPRVPLGYIVTLREPSVIRFESRQQLTTTGKALGLRPTAPIPEQGRFDPSTNAVQAYRGYLRQQQDRVLAELNVRVGKSMAAVNRWDMVGNGFALKIDAETATRIAKHPDVLSVVPDYPIELQDFSTPQTIGADPLWFGGIPGILATRGEGIVIGILDSGIDPEHPAFAETAPDGYRHRNPRNQRFGLCQTTAASRCNDKLIGIHDFSGNTNTDPGIDGNNHGTAVASRAAGNPVTSVISDSLPSFTATFAGVAPRANLVSYKIFGPTPGSVLASVNQAVVDRVDVINMSFSTDQTETSWQDPMSMALLELRAAGIVPIAGAGNAGPERGTTFIRPGNLPWVTAVAANRNNKDIRTRLADVQGFGISTPLTFHGEAFSGSAPESELVFSADFGAIQNQCAMGPENNPANPFPPASLVGKIVVCDVGMYTVAKKLEFAVAAGASGVVLAGTQFSGAETFALELPVPGTFLNFTDGASLKSRMTTAKDAGQRLRARIEGSTLGDSPITGLLAGYSSRGPVPQFDGVLKPNLAAPGPYTYAALRGTAGYGEFSGTSSSSPAVAGAAALIRAAHPDWTVDQITSALETTGAPGLVPGTAGVAVVATPLDDGVGMVNTAAAARAGLSFGVTIEAYRNADAFSGGNTEQLNLPNVYSRRCLSQCTFTRRVTANTGGTWTVATSFDTRGQLTVSPSQFSLAAGQSAEITIRVVVRPEAPIGAELNGLVRLTHNTPDSVAETRIPVAIERRVGDVVPFNVMRIDHSLDLGERPTVGSTSMQTMPLSAIDEVSIVEWPLRSFVGRDEFIADGGTGVYSLFKPTAAGNRTGVPGKMLIRIESATAPDIDLYVYEDTDGNGTMETFRCAGLSTSSTEQCEIDVRWTSVNTFAYYLQSFDGSPAGDQVAVSTYNEVASAEGGLVVTSERGSNQGSARLPMKLHWDMTRVPQGGNAIGYFGLAQDDLVLETTRVQLRRDAGPLPPVVLNGRTDRKEIMLMPGQAHERVIVDVAANQTALVLRTSVSGASTGNVDLHVSKVTGDATPPTFGTAPPRNQQPFSSTGPNSLEVVGLEGAQLSPGRYFVTPVNNGSTPVQVRLEVTGEFSPNIVQPAANGYFNPARSGHGVFLAKTPQVWALAWYTFDSAGKPIWYTAQGAAAAAGDGVWTAPLYRSTWNGVRDNPQEVGKVILTFDGTGSFTYSWFLDGQYGSEPFQPIGAPVCANGNFSVGGGWLRPDQSGWGSYFLNFGGNFEAEAIYVYDNDGLPRWVIGDGTYAGTLQKNLFQVSGFCPTCAAVPTTRVPVGTASRTLTTATTGTFSSNITFADGLTGNWVQTNVPWAKLTPNLACQ